MGRGSSHGFGGPLEIDNLRVQSRVGYRAAALRLGGGLLLVAELPERMVQALGPDYIGMLPALITHAALQELLGRVMIQAPPASIPARPSSLPVYAPPTGPMYQIVPAQPSVMSGEIGAQLVHAGPNASVRDQLLALAVNSAAPMATQLVTSQLPQQTPPRRPAPLRPTLPGPGARELLAGDRTTDGQIPGWLQSYVSRS